MWVFELVVENIQRFQPPLILLTNKKKLKKIAVDRKIVEGLREGHSLTSLTKSAEKGEDSVVKTRDLAIEHGYINLESAESQTY